MLASYHASKADNGDFEAIHCVFFVQAIEEKKGSLW
jgi:hypothetical protein